MVPYLPPFAVLGGDAVDPRDSERPTRMLELPTSQPEIARYASARLRQLGDLLAGAGLDSASDYVRDLALELDVEFTQLGPFGEDDAS